MSIEELAKKIGGLKEVTPDDRIDLNEAITELDDQVGALREALGNLPDVEPEQGEQNPRDAFVDNLIAEAAGDEKGNNGKNTRTVAVE